MVSFKSRLFNFMMRNRHLFQGKLKREIFDFNTSIENFRKQCEKGAARMSVSEGVKINREIIQGMNSEWLIPEGAPLNKMIMYVHGGGYVSGSCSDHRGIISKLTKKTGITCLLYEYRLAPEHPFPAALEDSVEVYQWLISSGYTPENILIAGESAGGGLVLAILLALKERKIPMPVAAVAISPWTDLTCSSDSYKTKNKVSVAPLNSWFVFSQYYMGKNKADMPLISPLFGNLKELPPLYINSGEADELYDDGEKFYEKAKAAGVNVVFKKGEGMIHCYPLLAPLFPEATKAMDEIVDFIRKYLLI